MEEYVLVRVLLMWRDIMAKATLKGSYEAPLPLKHADQWNWVFCDDVISNVQRLVVRTLQEAPFSGFDTHRLPLVLWGASLGMWGYHFCICWLPWQQVQIFLCGVARFFIFFVLYCLHFLLSLFHVVIHCIMRGYCGNWSGFYVFIFKNEFMLGMVAQASQAFGRQR